MKSLLFAAMCLATCMAQAITPVEGGNVATLIEVEYAKENPYTLIAVPVAGLDIAGAGSNTKSILADLLPPANYDVGTTVYFYADGTYYSWTIKTSGEGNVWEEINSVPAEADEGGEITTPPSSEHNLEMGNALWLQLPPGSTQTSTHLAGQLASLTSMQVGPGHNLVAFGGTNSVSVAAIKMTPETAGTKGDLKTLYRIFLPDEKGKNISLAYNNEKWYNTSTGKGIDGEVKVLPGKGFWFINPLGVDATISVNTDTQTETP